MSFTFASINVNGIRAAMRRGMGEWLNDARPDVVALQEVRADNETTAALLGEDYVIVQNTGESKGRAGVAVACRRPADASRRDSPLDALASAAGRWIEVDLAGPGGRPIVVCSTYVHTGQADDPVRMTEKLGFLDAAVERVGSLVTAGERVVVAGDFNVARDEHDIKNWKGNRGKAGFLPDERDRLDALVACGTVDVARAFAGDVDGPYTWWSWRGRAYDNDAGWRIDYVFASAELASVVDSVSVHRAPSYDARWSDHSPVVVSF